MTEQQAFIRQICEQPADDTVRLVYADWLQEQGDAERAEFIRVQVELAQPEPSLQYLATQVDNELLAKMTRLERGGFNFHELRARSYPIASKRLDAHRKKVDELHRRERRLFEDGYTYRWGFPTACPCTPFPATYAEGRGDGITVGLIRRGFLEEMRCAAPDFEKYAKELFAAHPITSVRLTDVRPSQTDREPGFRDYYCWPSLQRSRRAFLGRHLKTGHDSWRDTAEECMADLSAACVAYGRALANLLPLA